MKQSTDEKLNAVVDIFDKKNEDTRISNSRTKPQKAIDEQWNGGSQTEAPHPCNHSRVIHCFWYYSETC